MRKEIMFMVVLVSVVGLIKSYSQVYKDPEASIVDQVEDLLKGMTLEEKIGQVTQAERGQFSGDHINNITNYFVGSILSGGGSSPGKSVQSRNRLRNFDRYFGKRNSKDEPD